MTKPLFKPGLWVWGSRVGQTKVGGSGVQLERVQEEIYVKNLILCFIAFPFGYSPLSSTHQSSQEQNTL